MKFYDWLLVAILRSRLDRERGSLPLTGAIQRLIGNHIQRRALAADQAQRADYVKCTWKDLEPTHRVQ